MYMYMYTRIALTAAHASLCLNQTPTGRAFEGQGAHTPHTAHYSAPHTACPVLHAATRTHTHTAPTGTPQEGA